jgi:hypothetical protein
MLEIVSVGAFLYEITLFSKRTPLDLSLFVGAFLAIQGLLSFQWLYSSFFCNCGEFINGFPVSFYENLIMLVGFVLYIGSLSLMLLGVGGTENKLPSKHSILDFMFTLGPFLFFSGFIGFASWGGWSALLSVPLILVGIEMTAVSSYYLRRDFTRKGEHVLAWELTFLVSLGWLLIILFVTSSGLSSMPFVNPYISPTEYELIALSIIGMAIGAEGLWYTSKKKRETKYGVISTTNVGRGGDLDESKTINHGGRGKIFLFASLMLITILSLSWFVVGYYNNINNPCGGAFGFGGCNVKIIQLESGTLFSGPLPTSPTCSKNNSAYLFAAQGG